MSKLKMTIKAGPSIDVLRVTVSKINEPQSPLWQKWFHVKKITVRRQKFFGLIKSTKVQTLPINVSILDLEDGRYYVRYFDCRDEHDLGNMMQEYIVQTNFLPQ